MSLTKKPRANRGHKLLRDLAIDRQSQITALLLFWLGFCVRVYQAYLALKGKGHPTLEPIGFEGLKRMVDQLEFAGLSKKQRQIRLSEIKSSLGEFLEGVSDSERLRIGRDSIAFRQIAWLGAKLLDTVLRDKMSIEGRLEPILSEYTFASKDGFYFPNLDAQFPHDTSGNPSEDLISDYLMSFYNNKLRRNQIYKSLDLLANDLYKRINKCRRIKDPFPFLFQRVAIKTAIVGFAEAMCRTSASLFLMVREARSPNSPNWEGGHQLVRDLLFVRTIEQDKAGKKQIFKALFFSANDEVVYELCETQASGENTFLRLDGAKVEGNVQEHQRSAVVPDKFISLCLNKQLLYVEDLRIHDGILFAQRGNELIPGAWIVLSGRLADELSDKYELGLRQLIDPHSAILWLKQHRIIGAFPHNGSNDRALARFLRRTAFTNQDNSHTSAHADTKRIEGALRQHFGFLSAATARKVENLENELDTALNKVTNALVKSHKKHARRVSPRSIILSPQQTAQSSERGSEALLRKELFTLGLQLSSFKAT